MREDRVVRDRFKLADGRVVTFDELKEQDLPKLVPVFNMLFRRDFTFIEMKGFQTLKVRRNGFKIV